MFISSSRIKNKKIWTLKRLISHLYISLTLSSLYIYIPLWGQRIWQPRAISYQAQGPRRGGRNVWGQTKKVQTGRRCCRGQSRSQQTKITEGESGTPPKAVSQSVPRESTSAISQLWEYSGRAIPK